jgi:co-chaperonin GroES (HSP10)
MKEERPKTRQEKESEEFNKRLQSISQESKNIIIPDTKMLPAPNRIYVIAVVPEPVKTKSGIIIPNTVQAGYRGEDTKTFTRFFCVALGDEVKKQTFGGQKLEPGDEIMYMDIADAIRVEIPKTFDTEYYDRTGEQVYYYVFDVMEITGIVKRKKEKEEK